MFTISRSEGPRGPGPTTSWCSQTLIADSIHQDQFTSAVPTLPSQCYCPPTSLYCLALCLGFKVIERIGVGFGKVTLFVVTE